MFGKAGGAIPITPSARFEKRMGVSMMMWLGVFEVNTSISGVINIFIFILILYYFNFIYRTKSLFAHSDVARFLLSPGF